MSEKMSGWEERLGVKITYSEEVEPMGTAGPLGLARDILKDADCFFVLNSDVTCQFPLKELLAFHKNHGHEGTIMATSVDEPSKYGVVVSRPDGRIERYNDFLGFITHFFPQKSRFFILKKKNKKKTSITLGLWRSRRCLWATLSTPVSTSSTGPS
jgi:NDP-sugar pyrophosphorylase family protein